MHVRLEAVVGASIFVAFFLGAQLLGAASGNIALRGALLLVGLGGGGAMGVFAGLATHLARGPARYEPLTGARSAWGLTEYNDAGDEPPR
jgi:hypothetical protein